MITYLFPVQGRVCDWHLAQLAKAEASDFAFPRSPFFGMLASSCLPELKSFPNRMKVDLLRAFSVEAQPASNK